MAQQTHAQIIDALAAIVRGIRGINISYGSTNLPQSLVTFPAAMVLLGMDDYNRMGITEYVVRVYVAPVATGSPSKAYQDCLSLSTDFHTTFTPLQFVGDRYVDRRTLTTRAGFGNTGFGDTMKWRKAEFYGFAVLLPLLSSIPGN